jgi:large subunit ribosomal protein L2
MGIIKHKPTTHTLRWTQTQDFVELTADKPHKPLLRPLKKTGGRNIYGRVTLRHRGGGHKRRYRLIDFKRDRTDEPATVLTIEYDPNRSGRIALVEYPDRQKRYCIAPLELRVGDTIVSSYQPETEIRPGNCVPLRYIPLGLPIHNIELTKGKGGQIVRSAGAAAVITAKEGNMAQVRLPSGEVRLVCLDCRAAIGQVSNVEHEAITLGKAGRKRWLGIKPTVRGLAMNPIDHPHGGGEGKSGQGNPHPVTPWGKPTKGYKTRKPNKYSDKFIIKRRK